MKKALKIIAVVSIIAAMFLSGIEKNGDRLFIGEISGDYIRFALGIIACFAITILLVMFFREKPEDNAEKPKKSRSVLAVLATMFDAGLTFAIVFTLIFVKFDKPVKVKSPDGEHYIIRVETSDWLGHTKYNFYIKEKGIKYHYIFDSDVAEPEIEWTGDGVKFQDKLYKY